MDLIDLTAFHAQFISKINHGCEGFYLCRSKACLLICRNDQWASTVKHGGGHYRCPSCGTWHRPW
eukprot:12461916-Prorocentrum_lima.AAC.1